MRGWRGLLNARAQDGRPKLFIHAGLHKTGTTALQEWLARNRAALAGQGILYPRAGCPGEAPGQHNLAWQLMRDRRFHSAYGTLEDLAAEIEAHSGDVLLSSEDFGTLLERPEMFDALALHPRLKTRRVVLVVYMREQLSCFRSLFVQLTRNGLAEEVPRLVEEIFETGKLRLKEWEFLFDYGRVAARLAGWRHGGFVLRNYHRLEGGGIVPDFLNFLRPGWQGPDAGAARVNEERDLLEALLAFYGARLPLPLNEWQSAVLAAESAKLEGASPGLSEPTRRRFAQRFRDGNRDLERVGGRRMRFPDALVCGDDNAALERLFSFEMQCRLMGSGTGR